MPPAQLSASPTTDERVLAAFERNDARRAELLYDHLIGTVEVTLLRVMGHRDQDFDDLVQSAFEQVLISLRGKRFEGVCSLRSWAASITCHVGLNALRSRGTRRKYLDRDDDFEERIALVSTSDDPERGANLAQELARLRRELAKLSPEQARTLLLHDAFGYELAEIAVLTNASVAAAQSRLVRGRKALRERLLAPDRRSEEPS